jgi:hypothetical protein
MTEFQISYGIIWAFRMAEQQMIPLLPYSSEYSVTALQDSIAFVSSNTFLSLPTKIA